MKLEGSVERVTFHSEETGFSVLKVQVKGQRDLVAVVGSTARVHPGEVIQAEGTWIQNTDYGQQFKADSIQVIPPSTLEGIQTYLGSGMVKGIGPHFAGLLIRAFGEKVFEILDQEPEKLKKVSGIGQKRYDLILSSWRDQKVIRTIMVFLQSHGISPSKAIRIFKTYGEQAVARVQENPYHLARDIQGIGFKSADVIAQKMGIEKHSLIRARAGLSYALMEAVQKGHCAYPQQRLLQEASELLDIPQDRLAEALELEVAEKELIREEIQEAKEKTLCVYLASLHFCESKVADFFLKGFLKPSGTSRSLFSQPQVLEAALGRIQAQMKLELHPIQKKAVQVALSSSVTLITGGPGTGKSTLTRAIVSLLQAQGARIALCSPTGRAAKRLAECTGMEAKTIHRLLGFPQKQEGELKVDWLLIDEMSMVDIQLFYALLKRVPPTAGLIFIGDVDQLPSVGPGRVLADLIDSQTIPTVRLTQVFRQAAESRIIRVAHDVNQGRLPELGHQEGSDFFFIHSEDPEKTVPQIMDLVSHRIPKKFGFDSVRDIQVLCPMQRGLLGARNLNQVLQQALNPNPKQKIERFGHLFGVGDKVMVLANDYDKEVFNGDLGWIESLDLEEQECTVNFEGRQVLFAWDDLDLLQPAYTMTIHKSQGSEYSVVVIPIATQHYPMLQRKLIYTAITRGKKLVILIGQKRALTIAIKAFQESKRWTGLRQRLASFSSSVWA